MNKLTITQLNKTYPNGVKALDDISLEITNGMFGLLGPNGAGKSSLMRTIAGLQMPDSGKIIFNDVDTLQNPQHIKKTLGYLPQDFGVYPKISAIDLLNHLAILKGITSKADRKDQINSLLQKTNLYQNRHQAVSTFSGGMRQRFGIAQALIGNPQIIIVDEPTAGLDPEERNRFNNLLSEIGESIIILLSTHLVEDVSNLCSRMSILTNGKLLVCGTPQQFIESLKDTIWIKKINKQEKNEYEKQYQVISTGLQAGQHFITVYSSVNPGNGFSPKQASLEDVYFNQLAKN